MKASTLFYIVCIGFFGMGVATEVAEHKIAKEAERLANATVQKP